MNMRKMFVITNLIYVHKLLEVSAMPGMYRGISGKGNNLNFQMSMNIQEHEPGEP